MASTTADESSRASGIRVQLPHRHSRVEPCPSGRAPLRKPCGVRERGGRFGLRVDVRFPRGPPNPLAGWRDELSADPARIARSRSLLLSLLAWGNASRKEIKLSGHDVQSECTVAMMTDHSSSDNSPCGRGHRCSKARASALTCRNGASGSRGPRIQRKASRRRKYCHGSNRSRGVTPASTTSTSCIALCTPKLRRMRACPK